MAGINEEAAAAHSINPMLLTSARKGFWEVLDFLFQREDAREPSQEFPAVLATAYGRIGVSAPPDAELDVDHQPAAGALLQGVTPDGDTALHVVASNGNDEDFFKCAGKICARDTGLLYAKNHNGYTPFHCAVRGGNPKMVSHLIDLAGRESAPRNINALLLLSARVGSSKALTLLFEREDRRCPEMLITTEEFLRCLRGAEPDPHAEEGVDHQPGSLAAPQLLKGVTHDGDTALHAVASNKGDGDNFLVCADMICRRDWDLLFAKNHNGDTPFHCAARAGNSNMVSRLMVLARHEGEGPDGELTLLRMQNNCHETALHEAIRIEDGRILSPGDRRALFLADHPIAEKIRNFVRQQQGITIVKHLMDTDPQLASYPAEGISPMYLAILLEKSTIAVTLYIKSGGNDNLSYSGADGQNALHIALLRSRDTVMVELLLDWKSSLTAEVDKDGSTPLLFGLPMSSSLQFRTGLPRFPWCRLERFWPTLAVYRKNRAALYQADKNGFYPIHMAATVGALRLLNVSLWDFPDSAGLRDAEGKTFLHVATEKGRPEIVSYACQNPALAWILNMQDNDGNTAVHLAIRAGSFRMFCSLFGNEKVNLNITNNKGETPHDLSRSTLPRGMWYRGKPEFQIYHTLQSVRANQGTHRWDKNEEKYGRRLKAEEEDTESERLKDATQRYIVASVLIANMAFGATFGIPGGYKADGGTPTLAGGYFFDAFIVATALAFICSLLATTGFMLAGIPMVGLETRKLYIISADTSFSNSVTCMSIAFALGVYIVLAPVSRGTAIAVCAVTPVAVVGRDIWRVILEWGILVRPLMTKKGPFRGMLQLVRWSVWSIFVALWPFAVTFGWPGLARIHWGHLLLRVIHNSWLYSGYIILAAGN